MNSNYITQVNSLTLKQALGTVAYLHTVFGKLAPSGRSHDIRYPISDIRHWRLDNPGA